MTLMKERDERNRQIQLRLLELDEARDATNADYWLQQYVRLVAAPPASIVEAEKLMSRHLLDVIHACAADRYTAVLARHNVLNWEQLRQCTDEQLGDWGVDAVDVRRRLLAFDRAPQEAATSSTDSSCASITAARFEMECVVCLNAPVDCLFISCGHVCCCVPCANNVTLTQCPLCRAHFDMKI